EAFGPACVAVHDHLGRLDRAERGEHFFEVTAGHAVGQVAHVQLLAHGGPPQETCRSPGRNARPGARVKNSQTPYGGQGEGREDDVADISATARPARPVASYHSRRGGKMTGPLALSQKRSVGDRGCGSAVRGLTQGRSPTARATTRGKHG